MGTQGMIFTPLLHGRAPLWSHASKNASSTRIASSSHTISRIRFGIASSRAPAQGEFPQAATLPAHHRASEGVGLMVEAFEQLWAMRAMGRRRRSSSSSSSATAQFWPRSGRYEHFVQEQKSDKEA